MYNALSDCCNTARQRKLGDRRLGLLNQIHGKKKVLIWEIYALIIFNQCCSISEGLAAEVHKRRGVKQRCPLRSEQLSCRN
jgi:hypothetical protein